MVTLSFVMTGCGGKSKTCSLSEIPMRTWSMKGTLIWRPLFQVVRYDPRRSTMAASACGTIFTQVTAKTTTMTTSTMRKVSSGIAFPFDSGRFTLPVHTV